MNVVTTDNAESKGNKSLVTEESKNRLQISDSFSKKLSLLLTRQVRSGETSTTTSPPQQAKKKRKRPSHVFKSEKTVHVPPPPKIINQKTKPPNPTTIISNKGVKITKARRSNG